MTFIFGSSAVTRKMMRVITNSNDKLFNSELFNISVWNLPCQVTNFSQLKYILWHIMIVWLGLWLTQLRLMRVQLYSNSKYSTACGTYFGRIRMCCVVWRHATCGADFWDICFTCEVIFLRLKTDVIFRYTEILLWMARWRLKVLHAL